MSVTPYKVSRFIKGRMLLASWSLETVQLDFSGFLIECAWLRYSKEP